MARPMGVDVSNSSRMETNATFSCASRSMRAVKSPMLRLIRSRPVDDEHTEAPGLGRAHHPPEGGAVQVPAGEAVIFKNFRLRRVRLVRAENSGGIARIFVAHAFTLAGEAGFSGVDRNALFVQWRHHLLCDVLSFMIA